MHGHTIHFYNVNMPFLDLYGIPAATADEMKEKLYSKHKGFCMFCTVCDFKRNLYTVPLNDFCKLNACVCCYSDCFCFSDYPPFLSRRMAVYSNGIIYYNS